MLILYSGGGGLSMRQGYRIDPLNGGILKNMLLFAIPTTLTALLQMFFSAADTVILGRFGHENAISAIGVSASLLNMLVGGMVSLSSGVVAVVGRISGRGGKHEIKKLVQSIPLTAALIGMVLSVFTICFSGSLLQLLNCPIEIFADAQRYLCIYVAGLPFTLVFSFLSAILQARGNSLLPFLFQLGASILNIGLNLLFVIQFDWNVVGVASATAVSQVVLAVSVLVSFALQKDETRLTFRNLRAFRNMKEVFSLGIPSSLEGMALNLSSVVISAAINRFDPNVIAGNTVANTVSGLMSVTFAGFSNAGVVFVSQNYGNGNMKRVRDIYRVTLLSAFAGAECVGLLIYLASPAVIALFTDVPNIAVNAKTGLFYLCCFYGFCGTMNVISGCVRGLNEARLPLVCSLLSSVVFRIIWVCTYAARAGTIEAIYISYPICWGLCTFLDMVAFRTTFQKRTASLIQQSSERNESK